MFYGLYHEDNDTVPGAPGFQESQKWSLISCDRDGDGDFDNADLTSPPSPYDRREIFAECNSAGSVCYVDEATEKDVVTTCTTGNCLTEIVTTIRVNLDQDCTARWTPGWESTSTPGQDTRRCSASMRKQGRPHLTSRLDCRCGQTPCRRASLRLAATRR